MHPTFVTRRLATLLALVVLALSSCTSKPGNQYGFSEVWIPLPDGVKLAADIYWPTDATTSGKYPVLLEYLPYRKDESRDRCYSLYSYFQQHGYIVARVDIRGTGRSDPHARPPRTPRLLRGR